MTTLAASSVDWRRVGVSRAVQFLLGIALLAIYLPAVADLPRIGSTMLALQCAYGALLLFLPRLWLFVLPLITVALDLTPWSGRFLFSEYDGFIAVTLAAGAIGGRFGCIPIGSVWGLLLLTAYAGLYLANIADLGAFLDPPGQQFGNPYYDQAYSYKVGKGLVWGLLLAWLWLGHASRDREATIRWSLAGIASACLALLALAFWERGTLASIADARNWWAIAHAVLDFSSDYRITGIFADMHTGGEFIDGLMILLFPLVFLPLLRTRDLRLSTPLLASLLALGYCIVIGVTRATWAAAGVAFLATGGIYLLHQQQQGNLVYRHIALRVSAFALCLIFARYLYAQGGADALLVYGSVVAVSMTVGTIARLGILEQGVLLVAALLILSYLALSAHLNSRYATPDAATGILVSVSVLATGAGCWLLARALALRTLGERLRWTMLLIAFPGGAALALGGFSINERMNSTGNDLQTRIDHWQRVVESAPEDSLSRWFGSGVGTFPRRYIETYPDTLATIGSFALPRVDTPVLRMGAGNDLAVYQRIDVEPAMDYEIEIHTRSMGTGTVRLLLCQQNQLIFDRWTGVCAGNSFVYGQLDASIDERGFESHSGRFNTGRVAALPAWQRWPVSLQLVHVRGASPVEVTGISLRGPSGQLVRNGDFSKGLDRWFFHANFAHLPWHIKNLWLESWYETGYLGLLLQLALVVVAAFRALTVGQREPVVTASFLSVVAVFILGAFGSPLESSRVSLWFYLLLTVALVMPQQRQVGAVL